MDIGSDRWASIVMYHFVRAKVARHVPSVFFVQPDYGYIRSGFMLLAWRIERLA
jgi:hypothetical protein